MELTTQNVEQVFIECLFDDNESHEVFVRADGVQMRVGFHPGRLKENEANIASMLDELPDNFKVGAGGGWLFLNACSTKDGNQWADDHRSIDLLVCLGLAAGMVQFQLPRDMWETLPGGMPYFSVNTKKEEIDA